MHTPLEQDYRDKGAKQMTDERLRQFLFENFGWDIYDWEIDDIRF